MTNDEKFSFLVVKAGLSSNFWQFHDARDCYYILSKYIKDNKKIEKLITSRNLNNMILALNLIYKKENT